MMDSWAPVTHIVMRFMLLYVNLVNVMPVVLPPLCLPTSRLESETTRTERHVLVDLHDDKKTQSDPVKLPADTWQCYPQQTDGSRWNRIVLFQPAAQRIQFTKKIGNGVSEEAQRSSGASDCRDTRWSSSCPTSVLSYSSHFVCACGHFQLFLINSSLTIDFSYRKSKA